MVEEGTKFELNIMGISVPIEKEVTRQISYMILDEVNKALKEGKVVEKIATLILQNPKYIKKALMPIIEELITEEMDFKARLKVARREEG